MTQRVFNFSAGPAVLPEPVLAEAQRDLMALPGVGASILEISHRSPTFENIIQQAETNLRQLLAIPDDYAVLLLQGGGRLHVFDDPHESHGGRPAAEQLSHDRFVEQVRGAGSGEVRRGTRRLGRQGDELRPVAGERRFEARSEGGVSCITRRTKRFRACNLQTEPEAGDVPLVCDASSDFLSRPVDMRKYGVLLRLCTEERRAGGRDGRRHSQGFVAAQQRDAARLSQLSDSCRGAVAVEHGADVSDLHLDAGDEVAASPTSAGWRRWKRRIAAKAKLLYDVIDASDGFYTGHAQPECRSMMNVSFRLPSDELTNKFVKGAEERRHDRFERPSLGRRDSGVDLQRDAGRGRGKAAGFHGGVSRSRMRSSVEWVDASDRSDSMPRLVGLATRATSNDRLCHASLFLIRLLQKVSELLDAAPGIEYEVRTGLKGDALREALAQFDGAICRSGVQITAESLEGNRRLKAIVRAGVGTDNIDKDAATQHGIVVMNTPGGNTLSTAEHTIALMLALSRNIAPAYREPEGRQVGAQQVHGHAGGRQDAGHRRPGADRRGGGQAGAGARNECARVTIRSCRKSGRRNWASSRSKRLPTCCRESIILTVHTPLTDETRGLVGAAQLERMKKGVRLINAARGGIYDEAALAEGLKSGQGWRRGARCLCQGAMHR